RAAAVGLRTVPELALAVLAAALDPAGACDRTGETLDDPIASGDCLDPAREADDVDRAVIRELVADRAPALDPAGARECAAETLADAIASGDCLDPAREADDVERSASADEC